MQTFFLNLLVVGIFFAQCVLADEMTGGASSMKLSDAPAAVSNPWRANVYSLYDDMIGTRSAIHPNAIYTFGAASLRYETFTLGYKYDALSEISLTGSYVENYAVTIFPTRGLSFADRTVGFSDTTLQWTRTLVQNGGFQLKGALGESLPTGDVAVKKPRAPGVDYAYFLQLGSGTFDSSAWLTPIYQGRDFQAGSKFQAITRLGHNVEGYALGNLYRADAWFDYPLADGFTPRLTGLYKQKSSIRGADDTIPRQPLTEFYYHDQINWDVSASLLHTYKLSPTASLLADVGEPIAQGMINYDRVVVATRYFGDVSITGTF